MKYLLRSMEDPNQFIDTDTFWMRWLGCGYREAQTRWEKYTFEVKNQNRPGWGCEIDEVEMEKVRELDNVYKQHVTKIDLKFSNHDGEYVAGEYVFPQKSINESTKDLWMK